MNIFQKHAASLLLLTGCGIQLQAQSALPYVLATSGGSGTVAGSTTLNFTVGEPFITTIGSNPRFTQGFQQPSTSGNPLPVQWLGFSGIAKGADNYLNWRTAQERNNDFFLVERSKDGRNFQTVATVLSKAIEGNSNQELSYTFTDKAVPAGVNYYRLQQIDKDKRSSYSLIVKLENGLPAQSFTISPNPARGKVYLSLPQVPNQAHALITDIYGRVVRSIKLTALVTEINLDELATGTYFISYTDGVVLESVKLSKE